MRVLQKSIIFFASAVKPYKDSIIPRIDVEQVGDDLGGETPLAFQELGKSVEVKEEVKELQEANISDEDFKDFEDNFWGEIKMVEN